jgi:hypothetical protein
MDQAAIDHIKQQIDGEVKKRFPGAARRVAVLQYGDDPVIEPGDLLVRVIIEAPEEREVSRRPSRNSRRRTARRSSISGTICRTSFRRSGGSSSAPATPAMAPGWCWVRADPAAHWRPARWKAVS